MCDSSAYKCCACLDLEKLLCLIPTILALPLCKGGCPRDIIMPCFTHLERVKGIWFITCGTCACWASNHCSMRGCCTVVAHPKWRAQVHLATICLVFLHVRKQDQVKNLRFKANLATRPKHHPSRRAVNLEWLLDVFLEGHPQIRQKNLTMSEVRYQDA